MGSANVFIRGGTTSAVEDNRRARARADARARRAEEDERTRLSRMDPKLKREAGIHAKQHTRDLGGHRSHAVIVLKHKTPLKKDIETHQICELHTQPTADGIEFVLQLCCPVCTAKLGVSPDEAQMHIRQSNRAFGFEAKRYPRWMRDHEQGIWVDEQNGQVYEVAGTIETGESFTCPNPSCNTRFAIRDNILHQR